MLIVYDRPGQLANQLWAFTNMISLARACRTSIIIVMRSDYLAMLDNKMIGTSGQVKIYAEDSGAGKRIKWLTEFVKYHSGKTGIINRILGLFPVQVINGFIHEDAFVNEYRKERHYIINSWEMRVNHGLFIRQSSFIRELIQPGPGIKSIAEKQMLDLREKGTVIVGVHIRRGDYKDFLGGKYYFDDSVYYQYMEKLTRLLSPFKVRFRVFSHEPVELKNFHGLDIYFSRELPPIGDLWAMSFCNLVIGPVSTFSMWASFWGQVPLFFINDAEPDISLSRFQRVIAQDTFNKNLRTEAA
jgi:hypothetical protein